MFQTDLTRRFEVDATANAQLAATVRLDSVHEQDFNTLFYPGRGLHPEQLHCCTAQPAMAVAKTATCAGVERHRWRQRLVSVP